MRRAIVMLHGLQVRRFVKQGLLWGLLGLIGSASSVWAQTGTITGIVVDAETQGPLPGVNVVLVGRPIGAATDAEGRYTLAGLAPGTYALRASFVGYQDQVQEGIVVRAGEVVTVNFALRPTAVGLEEVVVIGYGTRRWRDVTGSVASVSTEGLNLMPVTGPDQALAGRVAGLQVLQGSGIPGGGPQIQVRGVGAIGAGNQPLFVVDGFPLPSSTNEIRNPLNDINPEDIEAITVLKDASAAAIYGSRAANGVVIITTKSGRGQRPTVTINSSLGVQHIPAERRPDIMNAREFAQWMKEKYEDHVRIDLGREPTLEDIPEPYRYPESIQGVDWFDAVTRPALMSDLNVSVSGGSQRVTAYFSAGVLRQEGVLKNTDFTRYSLRANLRFHPSEAINLGLNVSPVFTQRNLPVQGGGGIWDETFARNAGALSMGQILVTCPIARIDDVQVGCPGTFSWPNPVKALESLKFGTESARLVGSSFIEVMPFSSLRLRSQLNTEVFGSETQFYRPSTIGQINSPPPLSPQGRYQTSSYVNWLNENTANWSLSAGHHAIEVLLGSSFQKHTQRNGSFTGQEYPGDEVQTLNAAARITGATSIEAWGMISYFGRINYELQGKYFLTASLRRDGSSRFGPRNRWGTFPAFALGWRISEESFMHNLPWIDDLKLRFSWGETGNNNIGNYDYISRITSQNYVLSGGLASGRIVSSLGNDLLGWEKTRETNLGLDITLFNNRIILNAEVYQSYTTALLLDVEIPPSSGFTTIKENRGKVRNRGLEVALQTINLRRNNLIWSSNFNVSINRNVVLELGPTGAPIFSGRSGEANPTHITMIGKPVGMFFGYVFEGLYRDWDDVNNSPHFPGAIPGNVKYRDVNGDGTITPVADFTVIGNPYPDVVFGITNTLTYKNFDVQLVLTGQLGGEKLMAFKESLNNIDGVFNIEREMLQQWRSPEDPGNGRVPTTAGTALGRVLFRDVNSLWVKDASHLAIKNITVRYGLPVRWFQSWMPIDRAAVYVSAQNVYYFTSYPGNPEQTNYNDTGNALRYGNPNLTPGLDYAPYPLPRTITLGVELSF